MLNTYTIPVIYDIKPNRRSIKKERTRQKLAKPLTADLDYIIFFIFY